VLVVTAEPDHKLALEAGRARFHQQALRHGRGADPHPQHAGGAAVAQASRASTARAWSSTVRERTAELQRFRSAMDATADAIFLLDAAMPMVDASDGACRMLGYPREALLRIEPPRPGHAVRSASGRAVAQLANARRRRPAARARLIELELMRADDLVAVPVELYWQLQQLARAAAC
jgi:PAS domain-containing protein